MGKIFVFRATHKNMLAQKFWQNDQTWSLSLERSRHVCMDHHIYNNIGKQQSEKHLSERDREGTPMTDMQWILKKKWHGHQALAK